MGLAQRTRVPEAQGPPKPLQARRPQVCASPDELGQYKASKVCKVLLNWKPASHRGEDLKACCQPDLVVHAPPSPPVPLPLSLHTGPTPNWLGPVGKLGIEFRDSCLSSELTELDGCGVRWEKQTGGDRLRSFKEEPESEESRVAGSQPSLFPQ